MISKKLTLFLFIITFTVSHTTSYRKHYGKVNSDGSYTRIYSDEISPNNCIPHIINIKSTTPIWCDASYYNCNNIVKQYLLISWQIAGYEQITVGNISQKIMVECKAQVGSKGEFSVYF